MDEKWVHILTLIKRLREALALLELDFTGFGGREAICKITLLLNLSKNT